MDSPHIAFVFVDGLGLGDPDSPHNPLLDPSLRLLGNFLPRGWAPPEEGGRLESLPAVFREEPLPFGGRVIATDASLGIPGLPQSATGQTSLLTGENGAAAIQRHYTGFPTKTLRTILARASIFKQIVDAGGSARFLNAFPPIFFELGETVWKRPMGATSWANRAAGLPFHNLEDALAERALFHDITHEAIRARGLDIPLRTPELGGEILARAAGQSHFTLFEFFQTDKAGHAMDADRARRELAKLEAFLTRALENLDLTRTTLVLTSDHGNVENLAVKTHTHNPVPTLLFGPGQDELAPRLERLENFTPAMVDFLRLIPKTGSAGADFDRS